MSSQPRRHSEGSLNRFKDLANTASGVFRHSPARRAIEEIEKDKRGWLRNGIAALAISGLGLGVAGAVAVTGSAHESSQGAAPGITVSHAPVVSGLPAGRTTGTSRSDQRPELDGGGENVGEPLDGTVDMTARRDAQKNAKVTDTSQQDYAAEQAADARAKALKDSASQAEQRSTELSKSAHQKEIADAAAKAAQAAGNSNTTTGNTTTGGTTGTDGAPSGDSGDYSPTTGDGQAHLPVNPGQYHIAATFGQVGSWARYHTGVDFAAPIGTPIHAEANGVVTNAGIGPASAWAGNYVVIKFSNGEQMLMAHMSSVSVSKGQQVTGGQLVGHVGMTGRAFGPHTHVELYPAGITPGDVYSAVNPVPWFTAHGLKV